MDFIVGLPPSMGYIAILVMVDRFSRADHLGVLPTHFAASKVPDIFATTISKLQGFPRSIITDNFLK